MYHRVGRVPSFRDSSLAWVIDEVGQYVDRSNAKIENLRAIVETFGRESINRIQSGRLLPARKSRM